MIKSRNIDCIENVVLLPFGKLQLTFNIVEKSSFGLNIQM